LLRTEYSQVSVRWGTAMLMEVEGGKGKLVALRTTLTSPQSLLALSGDVCGFSPSHVKIFSTSSTQNDLT
jgi:hypothetical protein